MKAFMVSLIILSVAFSGCVTTGDGNSDDGTSGMPTDDDFQGLDYIECMEHEDMERCWNVFVPKTVDLSQDVPMVIDLHGNTLTMQNQRDLSEFDDLAEETASSEFGLKDTITLGIQDTVAVLRVNLD